MGVSGGEVRFWIEVKHVLGVVLASARRAALRRQGGSGDASDWTSGLQKDAKG